MKNFIVHLMGGHEARKRSLLALSPAELDAWALQEAKKIPVPMNARQYFTSCLADSLIVSASTGSITALTAVFTPAQAAQAFPLGYGLAQPFAGQIYRFVTGGIMTTGTAGTLTLTPYYGPGTAQVAVTGGVSMGASAAQTYVASLTNVPWRIEGELVFRTISQVATTSTAWLTGTFTSQGTLATAGSGFSIAFGSTSAVSVDTTGTAAAGSFGALNFAATFSVASTLTAEYTVWQSVN
jgi:hypothetical protein